MSSAVYEGSTEEAFTECVDYYKSMGYRDFESDSRGVTLRLLNEDDESRSVFVAIWRKPLTTGKGFKVLREEF